MATSSSLTILTTCWAGVERARDFAADGAGAHPVEEALDDREVDVGFEQRQTHLAQGQVDVGVRQPAAPGQIIEGGLKLVR